jgi:hypothetical protein
LGGFGPNGPNFRFMEVKESGFTALCNYNDVIMTSYCVHTTHRVVKSTVHLSSDDPIHELYGVIDHPMHLGHTAHGVRVLDTPTVNVFG